MSISTTRIDKLLTLTRSIFASIPRPQCTKRVARALDDEWIISADRASELSALDIEKYWWEVADEELLEFCDVLFWLSPEGFRFYYPAFLSYTLRHWSIGHNRIHMETFETIGRQPQNVGMLTRGELNFIGETLTELTCDPNGSDYEWLATLTAIETEIRRKALTQ